MLVVGTGPQPRNAASQSRRRWERILPGASRKDRPPSPLTPRLEPVRPRSRLLTSKAAGQQAVWCGAAVTVDAGGFTRVLVWRGQGDTGSLPGRGSPILGRCPFYHVKKNLT